MNKINIKIASNLFETLQITHKLFQIARTSGHTHKPIIFIEKDNQTSLQKTMSFLKLYKVEIFEINPSASDIQPLLLKIESNYFQIYNNQLCEDTSYLKQYYSKLFLNEIFPKNELAKELNNFIDHRDNFFDFIEMTSPSPQEQIKNLLLFPITQLSSFLVNYEHMSEYISKIRLTDKEKDKFLYSFIKSRKNQINNPNQGEAIMALLNSQYKYDKEKLKPYSAFFNHVKTMLEEVPLDIIEPDFKTVYSIRINIRKTSKLLCTLGEYHIQKSLENFSQSIQNDQIETCFLKTQKRSIWEIIIYSNDSNIAPKTFFEQEIKDFLLFAKDSPQTIHNNEIIKKWLLQNKLKKQIETTEIKIKKTNKI